MPVWRTTAAAVEQDGVDQTLAEHGVTEECAGVVGEPDGPGDLEALGPAQAQSSP